ncbi:MAG: UpxY family transcription antiterminator [Muribaculaceae bacterium]|nr:UpxY family transcription antiterminator [Muribaculaceae bacterium]
MEQSGKQWFVMRDLKRRNSNVLAIHSLSEAGLEVFTPMTGMIMTIGGRRQKREVPVIQDLLFVHEEKEILDAYVSRCPTLQYRYCLGRTKNEPMVVRSDEMERFIYAVSNAATPLYYQPGELTKAMYGKHVRIVGGLFDGYEGRLLSVKGMRKRRLIVELPGLVTAAVELEPDYIQILG